MSATDYPVLHRFRTAAGGEVTVRKYPPAAGSTFPRYAVFHNSSRLTICKTEAGAWRSASGRARRTYHG